MSVSETKYTVVKFEQINFSLVFAEDLNEDFSRKLTKSNLPPPLPPPKKIK